MAVPLARGVMKKIAPRAALVSHPQARTCANPAAVVAGETSRTIPTTGSSMLRIRASKTFRRADNAPIPAAARNQTAPNMKNVLAAASVRSGMKGRRGLGAWS
jgi:hypothetical protein